MSTYNDKEVEKMVNMYSDNPCLEMVDRLSVLLNKPRKSIIAKLVKEGVYIRRGYRTKLGAIPITKSAIVREMEDTLDIKLPDLVKAPKGTLQALNDSIQDLHNILDEALEEIRSNAEINRVKQEIERVGNKFDQH